MFNAQTAAEIVRQRLQLGSSIEILWTIPEALLAMSRKVAANPQKRSLLLTDDTTGYPLTLGAVELADVTGALREYLQHGEIWINNPDDERYEYPLQPLKNPAFINAPKGNDYYHWYLAGNTLKTRNFDRNQPDDLEGKLYFSVPRLATITDVGASPELQPLLIEKMIEIATGPRNDAAEDGEN